jgi:hypothetical protein
MGEVGNSTGILITEDEKKTLTISKKEITALPVYEWLLSSQ